MLGGETGREMPLDSGDVRAGRQYYWGLFSVAEGDGKYAGMDRHRPLADW
jgi:hypothetical protein